MFTLEKVQDATSQALSALCNLHDAQWKAKAWADCGEGANEKADLASQCFSSLVSMAEDQSDLCISIKGIGNAFAAAATGPVSLAGWHTCPSAHALTFFIVSFINWTLSAKLIMKIHPEGFEPDLTNLLETLTLTSFESKLESHVDLVPQFLLEKCPSSDDIQWLQAAVTQEGARAAFEAWKLDKLCSSAPQSQSSMQQELGDLCRAPIAVWEANETAKRLARKDKRFVHGTAEEWAQQIREETGKSCSKSTVHKTAFWRQVMELTGRGRSGGPTPKTVSLTDNLESVVGCHDEELQKLIESQEADYEPSPLDKSPVKGIRFRGGRL